MLDAILIEPVLEKRTQLRELARNFCKNVAVASTLQDGMERIKTSSNCDVIYISSRFDFETAKQFVLTSRKLQIAQDSASLLIGSSESYSEAYLAKLSLNGFDGVLLEPASVETFSLSADIALKARKDKLQVRTKKSVDILVKAISQHLDELYLKKKSGHLSFMLEEKLKNLSKELFRLDTENLLVYFEAICDFFPECAACNIDKDQIGSASLRVQRRRLVKP
jgi:hypothetical protein